MFSFSIHSTLETVRQNLRLLPGRFSPTCGLLSAIDYLEPKLLRFQRIIWHINGFCSLFSSGDIVKKVNFSFSVKSRFCKKNKLVKIRTSKSSWMDSKKSLKTAILKFYKGLGCRHLAKKIWRWYLENCRVFSDI